MSMLSTTGLLLLALSAGTVHAANRNVMEKMVEYKEGDTVLEGFLARPATKDLKPRPAIIVVHEWMGLEDYAKSRARQLAELGYIAFAADIYGKTTRPKNQDEAAKFATQYRSDRALMRKRIQAAIDFVQKEPAVHAQKIAVIGYCFGGSVALEAARMNAPVAGIVSFHGGLASPTAKDTKSVKPRVLVLNGAADPLVSAEEIKNFEEEFTKGKADWQFVNYSGAVHGFTNPNNGPRKGDSPMAYDEKADKRSWQAMRAFFDEMFGPVK